MRSSSSVDPRTVEEIFKDYSGRRAAVIRALTRDAAEFYSFCDPDKENLCLYGHPNESWEVIVPADEVPPHHPEPTLGINFARDGSTQRDWLLLIALHSDSWLLSVAFYFGAHLNRNERKRLFTLINDLPTVFEVVSGRKPAKDKHTSDTGSKSRSSTKRSVGGQTKNIGNHDKDDNDDDEFGDTLCEACGENYKRDELWICCDICEKWFHCKCVKISAARAETIAQFKCPLCSTKEKKTRH